MPKIYYTGGPNDVQATGALLDPTQFQVYYVNRANPTDIISSNGHQITDAPTYETVEGYSITTVVNKNGRNVSVNTPVTSDSISSTQFTIQLPPYAKSVTDIIRRNQRNSTYDMVVVPETCSLDCNSFFWVGRNMQMGSSQLAGALSTSSENADEGGLSRTRTLDIEGEPLQYYGMENTVLSTASAAIYALMIVEDACAEAGGCPYQTIVRGGAAATVGGKPVLEYTDDGGTNWNAIDTTALPDDSIITDLAWVGGQVVIGYSDVVNGDGTAGGVAISGGWGAASLSTLASSSAGIQALLVLRGKIYAFGTNGEGHVSCDNGNSFTDITTGITETILDAAYDTTKKQAYLAVSNAQAWQFNGNSFVNISSQLNLNASQDVVSVEVTSEDSVIFGGADGFVYENYGVVAGKAWGKRQLGSDPIYSVLGSGDNYRTLYAVGDDVLIRDMLTFQETNIQYTTTGNVAITAGVAGEPLEGEGTNYYLFATTDGQIIEVSQCDLCLEDIGGCA